MAIFLKANEIVSQRVRDGNACVRAYVRTLDNSPGVYRMLDEKDCVLYVGKAKNLKKRVSSYSRPTGHSNRIIRMISETRSMLFLTTETETEALLLEQSLIKNLKPRYNVLLRDDKSFASIHLDKSHVFPQVKKHRGAKKGVGNFYGPFANVGAIERTLNQIQKAFLLRNCSDSVFDSRERPCLMYQIKRCSAPCVNLISQTEYTELVAKAEKFLSGQSEEMRLELVNQMNEASDKLEYEKAAGLRDRLTVLKEVKTGQGSAVGDIQEADVIALHLEQGRACIQVFFIRAAQNWGNKDYFPETGIGAGPEEILKTFIGQFYSNQTPPRLLLLSNLIEDFELMRSILSEKLGKKVTLEIPRRGHKSDLIKAAMRNARESLARKMADTQTQQKLLNGLKKALKLTHDLKRVEVYDNSHFQGDSPVGGMIVAGHEGFLRSEYRKFNIKSDNISLGDDYAMMREVFHRRFQRLKKEEIDSLVVRRPDLVIIDGGLTHVSVVSKVMKDLNLQEIPILGVSKGPDRNAGKEEFHTIKNGTFVFNSKDPLLYYVQRLRDEAHRFAIGTHRTRRVKKQFKSPLDEIAGIGAKRKKILLENFGSAKGVSKASKLQIASVEGISTKISQIIYQFFHDKE